MRRIAVMAAVALLGCDPASPPVGPPAAQASNPSVPDFRAQAGVAYATFVADPALARFAPLGLGLSEAEKARFAQAMAVAEPGRLALGGGAQALVFHGCAAAGCDAGKGVLAIDVATGAAFLGVRDAAGAEAVVPNDRIEALLRLSSPTRQWDDPGPPETPAPTPAQP